MDEIATFPNFSDLALSHQDTLENIGSALEPYSDFHFTSLYSWNVDATTKVAQLHGNLVVKMPDYLTGTPTHSVIGANRIDETLEQLLLVTDRLAWVPEDVVNAIERPELFRITEDEDSHDYVFSHAAMAALQGSEYHAKRKMINRFERHHEGRYHVEQIDFTDKATQKRLLETFSRWAVERARSHEEVSNEYRAIKRMLAIADKLNLIGVELFIDDKPVGFSIHEAINNEYTICHFHKTILCYVGADVFLTVHAARVLNELGYVYENWEQDLGIPGLRELKQSYQPAKMLKKYHIQKVPASV